MCAEQIQLDGNNLEWVINQTPELCMMAVMKNGLALKYVRNVTPELNMAAVKQNGLAINIIINGNNNKYDGLIDFTRYIH